MSSNLWDTTLEDIKKYLCEVFRILKSGGTIIGSSFFPETEEHSKNLCLENKYHLHICTKFEIEKLLATQGFKKIHIFQNRLFFMAKK